MSRLSIWPIYCLDLDLQETNGLVYFDQEKKFYNIDNRNAMKTWPAQPIQVINYSLSDNKLRDTFNLF